MSGSMIRDAILQLEKQVTRRDFLGGFFKGAALVAAFDHFGPVVFGQLGGSVDRNTGRRVFSRIGEIVIPVDQDPGWNNFEPDISQYALQVFAGQVLLAGDGLALDGLYGALNFFNGAPPQANFGPPFLEMVPAAQVQFFSAVLAGQFEKAGLQDLLNFVALFGLVATKGVFFSNFPYHLAQDSEYQVLPANKPRTGWDIMGWRGPIGPDEEKALRARFTNITVNPGIDPRNPFL